ncbi:MAG: radical SAM protein [Deltaproteobacteria bacterium]|nr:radical SAM protein [Deltaproteobacteria bacterium]
MCQKIIPIFVMYRGCPHRCIYCNERITAGNHPDRITGDMFRNIVDKCLKTMNRNTESIQIAFYGGNFTGIDKNYQTELLEAAEAYIQGGPIDSIRISTRPDYIDPDRVKLLKQHSVTTVEIGAQSMVDEVLTLSERGHTSDDVRNAVGILQNSGFKTGIHLMVGLPGDTEERFQYTVEEVIRLHPDMARIHPTIVFRNTALAEMYAEGYYEPLTLPDAVRLCKYALGKFETARIPVIRLGLQTTSEMETTGSIVAGPYHPAFRSLVSGSIFLDMASYLLTLAQPRKEEVTFRLHPKDVSDFRGMKNKNTVTLKERFDIPLISIREDSKQERGSLVLVINGEKNKTFRISNVEIQSPNQIQNTGC